MRIAIIGCGKNKLTNTAKAKDMYIGSQFKLSLNFALKNFNEKNIFILSAKYGLLPLYKNIKPYEETLFNKKNNEIKLWSVKVINQIKNSFKEEDELFLFCPFIYYKFVIKNISNKYYTPLKNVRQGYQRQYFKKGIL